MAAIHNQAGTDFLAVNPDGSININLAVSSSNPLPVQSANAAVASDGVLLPLSSLTETNTYSGGQIATSSVTYLGNTYTQTFTWTLGNLATISQWVKQS